MARAANESLGTFPLPFTAVALLMRAASGIVILEPFAIDEDLAIFNTFKRAAIGWIPYRCGGRQHRISSMLIRRCPHCERNSRGNFYGPTFFLINICDSQDIEGRSVSLPVNQLAIFATKKCFLPGILMSVRFHAD